MKGVDRERRIFFSLGTNPLESYDVLSDMASSTIYEPRIDRPLAEVNSSGTLTFYHQDWLGNVAMLTSAAGAKVQTYTYDVWGKPSGFDASGLSIPVSSFNSRFLFTGREYDLETGLYHYRARAYSPTLGRFVQTDPIDFSAGDENLFRYVGNNPVNLVDPLGLDVFFNQENEIGGHAWTKIGGNNPTGGNNTYGQYPDGPIFGKPAFIENPDRHTNDDDFSYECYDTTNEDEAELEKWIKDNFDINKSESSKNPNYNLGINDCRTFNNSAKKQLEKIIRNRGGEVKKSSGKVPK